MAQAASSFTDREPGLQVGRGGFLRSAQDVPYVSDPDATPVKSGKRKGEIKRLAYGSPSGFATQIESSWNLIKWSERREALGFGLSVARGDYSLVAMAYELAQLDVDSDEYKTLGDTIVARAKDIAEASLAADRGSFGHLITEDDDEGRDWIARAEAGELLGIPVDAQRALVQAWRDMLARDRLEILVSEASCVDDVWRLAGTLDNVARLTKSLRFALCTGDIVVIPEGTILILDKKTGQRRLERDGTVRYWHKYAPQVCSYAQSRPYDTVTEQRGQWPWPIDQHHALIAHLDVLAAINGQATCDLVYVDLDAARDHGGATVIAAKAWEKRKDVFSVAQLPDEVDVVARREAVVRDIANRAGNFEVTGEEQPRTTKIADPTDAAAADQQPEASSSIDALGNIAACLLTESVQPEPAGGSGSTPRPPAGKSTLCRTCRGSGSAAPDDEDWEYRYTWGPCLDCGGGGSRPPVLDCPPPDEGAPADPDAVHALQQRFNALPEHVRNGWWRTLTMQATEGHNGRGRVPYRLGEAQTQRRYWIAAGLVTLAESLSIEPIDMKLDTEVLRALVASVIDDDAVWWPTTLPGQAVGMLDAEHAATFAERCQAYVSGGAVGSIDVDRDRLVLTFAEVTV